MVIKCSLADPKESRGGLKDIRRKTKAILRTVGRDIIAIDSFSYIRFVNQELCSIFGYLQEELIGQSIHVVITERNRDAHAAGMKRYLAGDQPKILGRRLELEGLRKDGPVFCFSLNTTKELVVKAFIN